MDDFARRTDTDALAWRIDAIWAAMQAMAVIGDQTAARRTHLAGAATTISLLLGGTQAGLVVTWPGDGFATPEYVIEPVAIAAGISSVTVTSQTETTATVSVTAGLGLGVGAAFVLLGKS